MNNLRQELTSQTEAEFREHFPHFYDSIIHGIYYELARRIEDNYLPKKVIIILGIPNNTGTEVFTKVNLILEIEEIEALTLRQPKNSEIGVVQEIIYKIYEDGIFINFLPSEGNKTIEDYEKGVDFRHRKGFVVIGKRCFWSVQPYEERSQQKPHLTLP